MSGLRIDGLKVEIEAGAVPVDGVSLAIEGDECVVLLGESGCGKSLTALALMRLLPEGVRIAAGVASLDGEDLFALPERRMRALRGGRLAMIFQEPMTSLNPVLSIGQQVEESLAAHRGLAGRAARAEAGRLLEAVGLAADRLDAYPSQLSGGQRQRALIAMMLAGEPEVLIADEPTTALDVTVQAQILRLLKDLQRQRGMGLLLITHDLDVARDMADRVAVMYAGQIVEWATRERLYGAPLHPYTRRLFRVLPSAARRGEPLEQIAGRVPAADAALVGCRFAERCDLAVEACRREPQALREVAPGHWLRCGVVDVNSSQPNPGPRAGEGGAVGVPPGSATVLELRDLKVHFPIRKGLLRRVAGQVKAVDGVSLAIRAGETLALVGESGCGKTTLARAALRLIEPTAGEILLAGEAIGGLAGEALRRRRTAMQIVFQDPFSSLNPRMRVGDIVAEGLAALRPDIDGMARAARVAELLDRVGLPRDAAGRYPHEFSGGQRQRVAIARALAVQPRLLVCDEPTSALDVSVQAQILNLLAELQREQGLAYLFITHNLPVVGYLAHRVAVMYQGRIVEEGEAGALLSAPGHEYTRMLLESAPGRGLKG
ncbi:MAG: ABC transporter ATP-binding protein [Gallionellaceae bacterium]|nr:ABC transporter ATP-binding protein [Gallionellaceae bacterium]